MFINCSTERRCLCHFNAVLCIRFQWGPGSGSRFAIRIRIQESKNDPQKKKKFINIIFVFSLLKAAGFSSFQGGLEISKLQCLVKKDKFSFIFCSSKPWTGSRTGPLEMPDPYPDPESINPDPQHWLNE
jgi:hypothetical protein